MLVVVPLRLVVIDSMAAPVREEYDNNARDMRLRTGTLLKISALLRKMADRCGKSALSLPVLKVALGSLQRSI